MKNWVHQILAFSLACSLNVLFAQDKLNQAIDELRTDPAFRHASWSICVEKVADGRILAEYNADISLVPASTMKIATTWPAWVLLGPGFRFTTVLETDARIDADGTLNGSLYIKGDADPTSGSAHFGETGMEQILSSWTNSIKHAGIRAVKGTVIGDASAFPDELVSSYWLWGDIGNYYGAGAGGLNFHENTYSIIFKPSGREGEAARIIRIEPPVKDLDLDNRVTTGPAGSGDKVVIYGSPYSGYRLLEGTIPRDSQEFSVKGSIPDPALFTAQALSDYLAQKNIIIGNPPTTIRILTRNGTHISNSRFAVDTYKSPKLSSIIGEIHKESENTFCEALLLKIGKIEGTEGSVSAGLKVVAQFWQKAGIDISGMIMKDASGLSPLNRFSTRQLAGMMRVIAMDKQSAPYIQTLNLAGRTGDLKNLFTGSAAENNLRAKSGYMSTVRAYTGLVMNTKNEEIAFSVIVNNYDGPSSDLKKKLEKMMILLTSTTE